MAFITLTRDGRPLYRVRWNYRDKYIDGKPYDQKEFRNKREALDWYRRVGPGHSSGQQRTTIDALCTEWLDTHVDIPGRPLGTYHDYETTIRLRIRPYLGNKRAEKIAPIDAHRWVNQLKADGVSAATINKTIRTIRAMIRWSRGAGLTTCRAFDDLRTLPTPSSEHKARAYTPTELDGIEAACPILQHATIILTAAHTGLRRSELFALDWSHVDLDVGSINVQRAIDRDGSFKRTKTYETRDIPILAPGITALREWHATAGGKRKGLVFHDEHGQPWLWSWDRVANKIAKAWGDEVRLAYCRDTYASVLIAAGAEVVELTMAMGHRTVETTRKHYSDWLKPARESIAERANVKLLELRERAARS